MQIADLESRLHHTTMTASEEKRCVEDIGKLRKAKKAAAGADKKGEQAGSSEKRVEDLRADIKDCDDELNAIKEEQVGAGSLGNRAGKARYTHRPEKWPATNVNAIHHFLLQLSA